MKIAIPTDDAIMLSAHVNNPKGYLVLTVEGGEIINEELRWNKLSDILTSDNGIFHNLMDCSAVMVNITSKNIDEYFQAKNIEIITTREVIITKVILDYLEVTMLRESNLCCSP